MCDVCCFCSCSFLISFVNIHVCFVVANYNQAFWTTTLGAAQIVSSDYARTALYPLNKILQCTCLLYNPTTTFCSRSRTSHCVKFRVQAQILDSGILQTRLLKIRMLWMEWDTKRCNFSQIERHHRSDSYLKVHHSLVYCSLQWENNVNDITWFPFSKRFYLFITKQKQQKQKQIPYLIAGASSNSCFIIYHIFFFSDWIKKMWKSN